MSSHKSFTESPAATVPQISNPSHITQKCIAHWCQGRNLCFQHAFSLKLNSKLQPRSAESLDKDMLFFFILLQGTFIFSVALYKPLKFNKTYIYPTWAYALGWFLGLFCVLVVPLWIVFKVVTMKGTVWQVCTRNTPNSHRPLFSLPTQSSQSCTECCPSIQVTGTFKEGQLFLDESPPDTLVKDLQLCMLPCQIKIPCMTPVTPDIVGKELPGWSPPGDLCLC